ncbi:hypothetical protein VE00_05897 [Pseudogymnoascus sp. WSF 3629]|nr:hypothetical protein VE00_05897 [Pseudogymnoascus sp. WSF 3629]
MSDRRPPRPHSPAMYNPARASAPSINYGKYNDLHDLPASLPRPADRGAPPPVVTHYKVVPPEIPRSDPREGGHSRRATLDSNPRPIIVTADARYPVAQGGGGPASPVRDNYRSSQENDVYTIPSSSTRRGDYRRGQYNMSVDNADISGSLDRESGKDRLMRVGSGREGAIYPRSRPIHSDTLVRVPDNVADYGDNDYGYTNPRDLVQYDLDLDRAPRRRPRRESYEASRSSRPSSISSYGDITRSYEPRERERERERGPPPSSRGFDKIPPPRGPVYDAGGMHMPMPHEHLSSFSAPYASDSQERRSSTRRPVSVYNEEPERRKYAADAYDMSEDEMRDRRPRRTDTFDEGIETRGFGIRAEVPPVPPAPVPERIERSEKHEYEERGDRDEMEYERRHGHEERKHGHDERKHGKEAVAAGLSVAAAALGLGAMKGGREEEREREREREERERRRGRDSDEERRRRREKEEEPVDLSGRDHAERRRERDSDEERRRRREKEDGPIDLTNRDHGDRRRERDSDEERRRRREVKEEDPVVDLTGRDPVERLPPRPEKVPRDDSDVESRRRREKEKPNREDIDKDYGRREEKEPNSDKDQPPAIVDLNGRNPVEKPIYKEDLANREPVIEVPDRRRHNHHSPSPPTSRHDSRASPPAIDIFTPRSRKDRIRTDESNVSSPTTFNAKDAMDLRALREALNSKDKDPSPPPIPSKEPLRENERERERDRPSRESTDVPPRDSTRNRDSVTSSRESTDLSPRDAPRPRDSDRPSRESTDRPSRESTDLPPRDAAPRPRDSDRPSRESTTDRDRPSRESTDIPPRDAPRPQTGERFDPRDPRDLASIRAELSRAPVPAPAAPRERRSSSSHSTERRTAPRLVSPPRSSSGKAEDARPVKGILKPGRQKWPEDPTPIREGVAPLKDAKRDGGVPADARWTKISRKLVNPEALERGRERYEAREEFVIVLRVLSKEEVQGYATETQSIRAAREAEDEDRDARRRRRKERHERHRRERHHREDRDEGDDYDYERRRHRREREREHESHSESDTSEDERVSRRRD